MVQSVTLYQNLSKVSSSVGKVVKKSTCPQGVGGYVLPLIVVALGFLALKNNKKTTPVVEPQKLKTSLEEVEYSAWARLNDMSALNSCNLRAEAPVLSKDSNKWNAVFRN